jgi:hypothetical protein
MYTKEQIIEEIKRVAAKLDKPSLKEKEFEQNSTIPSSTLKYYLGSWKQALKEAGLDVEDDNKKEKPKDNEELLLELIRLHDSYGETPTPALIKDKGKYAFKEYNERWKSLNEAFNEAKTKYPPPEEETPKKEEPKEEVAEKEEPEIEEVKKEEVKKEEEIPEVPEIEMGPQLHQYPGEFEQSEIDDNQIEENIVDEDKETIKVPEVGNVKKEIDALEQTVSSEEDLEELKAYQRPAEDIYESPNPFSEENGEKKISENGEKMEGKTTIKFIPKTIKPKITKKQSSVFEESLDFRGLKYAPINDKGVAYIFGMVSLELGYIIEGIGEDPPEYDGRRCVDTTDNSWERIKINIGFKSSEFETKGEKDGELIVCWIHDWDDCPLEVLELKSTIQLLDDSTSI